MNYNRLSISSPDALTPDKIIKPKNFKAMVGVATKLSKDFPFVRVDLYSVRNKIYFGELTFSPAAGLLRLHQNSAYYTLGNMIILP